MARDKSPAGPAAWVAGPENMIADGVDGIVQPMQRLADPLPGQFGGLARGLVQAEPDVKQVPGYLVQQVLRMLRLVGQHAADQAGEVILPLLLHGVPGHGQDEMPVGTSDSTGWPASSPGR